MSYVKADDVLPQMLVEEIQKYVVDLRSGACLPQPPSASCNLNLRKLPAFHPNNFP